jgi:hypothetical protein
MAGMATVMMTVAKTTTTMTTAQPVPLAWTESLEPHTAYHQHMQQTAICHLFGGPTPPLALLQETVRAHLMLLLLLPRSGGD